MDRILRQPTDNGDNDAQDPLSGVIGLLLETYIDEVPKVHKKLLQSIPQQSALFHNNCMYLTHWVAQHANKGIDSFPSLFKMLQTTGTKYLRVQISYQESILMEIMSGFGEHQAEELFIIPCIKLTLRKIFYLIRISIYIPISHINFWIIYIRYELETLKSADRFQILM